jgi:hypothetical protein
MANVRRRLVLCYGNLANLEISTANEVTTVRFVLPAPRRSLTSRSVA